MDEDCEKEKDVHCIHDQSDPDQSLWIKPSPTERVHSPAQKRPYCKICGRIKYSGSANVKKMGFYVNLLKELQKRTEILKKRRIMDHKLTNVQIRLIVQDLERDEDFLDSFSNNRHNQWEHFKWIVKSHCRIEDDILEMVYRDFKG